MTGKRRRLILLLAAPLLPAAVLPLLFLPPRPSTVPLDRDYQVAPGISVRAPAILEEIMYFLDGGSYVFRVVDAEGAVHFISYPVVPGETDTYEDAFHSTEKEASFCEDGSLEQIPQAVKLDRSVIDPFVYSLLLESDDPRAIWAVRHLWPRGIGKLVRLLAGRRKFVTEHLHLVVKRRDPFTEDDQADWRRMVGIAPAFEALRRFVDDVHGLFEKGITRQTARRRRNRLAGNPVHLDIPQLQRAIHRVRRHEFEKMIVFVDYENLDRANDRVERGNRSFRMLQKM